MNCAIPILITILAANPCQVWEQVKESFQETSKRAWYADYARPWLGENRHSQVMRGLGWPSSPQEFFEHPESGSLTIEEVPGEFFLSFDGRRRLCGVFSVIGRRIRFSTNCGLTVKEILAHELGHWFLWRFRETYGEDAWRFFGHGGERDIQFQTLRSVEDLFYGGLPEGHTNRTVGPLRCVVEGAAE